MGSESRTRHTALRFGQRGQQKAEANSSLDIEQRGKPAALLGRVYRVLGMEQCRRRAFQAVLASSNVGRV